MTLWMYQCPVYLYKLKVCQAAILELAYSFYRSEKEQPGSSQGCKKHLVPLTISKFVMTKTQPFFAMATSQAHQYCMAGHKCGWGGKSEMMR